MLLSVEESDYQEVLTLAKRFYDLGITLYATGGTAEAIGSLGIPVTAVANATENDAIISLMESGALNYVIYTGAVKDATMGDFIALHRRAMQLGIPVLTSPDTASALAEIIASGFGAENTELVDINAMRPWQQTVRFAKMHSCGNDYIFIENFDGAITCPESLCVSLCDRHTGIGGDGIVLIERSRVADAKMRSYNRDGSEGRMAGNNIRCVGKYLYDKGYVRSEYVSIETASGVHRLRLFLRDGKVNSVSVDMGKATCEEKTLNVGGTAYETVCVDVGNPHCVLFCDAIDGLDLAAIGPKFEYHEAFPDRTNTEFVRVVNPTTLRMRTWERGSGETLACGTGACAAVAAAVKRGLCPAGKDVTVKLLGGDLTVNCTAERITLTGSAVLVFEGTFAY